MVQKLKKCLFLNWFLSKEVKKEGNLNSCWKESSVIYFCNLYFPRFGQYLYISLLSCIFGTKILVVVCIIMWFTSVAACKKAEVTLILKTQLILKHYANLKKSLQEVEKSKILFTLERYIKGFGESQIKKKRFQFTWDWSKMTSSFPPINYKNSAETL